jgi:hypothetical protein
VCRSGSPYSTAERMTALAIADHMWKSAEAWPSQSRLAEWTGLSAIAVYRALRKLTRGDLAIFDVVEAGGSRPGNRHSPARYRLKPLLSEAPSVGSPFPEKRKPLLTEIQAPSVGHMKDKVEGQREGPNQETPSFDAIVDQLADEAAEGTRLRIRAR